MPVIDSNSYKHTSIGAVPSEWELVRLMDVCVKGGLRNPQTEPEKEFLYVDVSSISNQTFRIVFATPTLGKHASSRARKVIRENDVLIATIRPSLKRVALVPKQLDGEICSTALCVLRVKHEAASPYFLFHVFLTDAMTEAIAGLERGSSYPAVTDGNVLSQVIPLPPLPEQRTIAAILSKIQQAIEVQERIIERTKELKKSLTAKLFTEGLHAKELEETEIGLMPKSWRLVRLGDFVRSKITDGTHVTPKYQNSGVKFVTATNLKDETIDFTECKLISFEEHEQLTKRCKPEAGDVLLSKVGTLGLVAKVEDGEEFSIFVQVALIKPKRDMLDSDYLLHTLGSDAMQTQIFKKSSTSTMKYIGVGKIAELVIPLPTMEEQRAIAGILREVNLKMYNSLHRLRLLRTLFKSMLNQLMTGQIRVNYIDIGMAGMEG